jgi:hypothetical protein
MLQPQAKAGSDGNSARRRVGAILKAACEGPEQSTAGPRRSPAVIKANGRPYGVLEIDSRAEVRSEHGTAWASPKWHPSCLMRAFSHRVKRRRSIGESVLSGLLARAMERSN